MVFQVRPDWAFGKEDAWRALNARWRGEDEEWNALSQRNKANRGSGGTHRAGNLGSERYKAKLVCTYIYFPSRLFLLGTHNISLAMQEEKLGRPVADFESWDSMRMKKPDLSQPQPQLPEYFGTAQEDGAKYLEVMVALNPEVEDPRTAEPDERALVVSGGGLQHGRLRVMDKMTPRTPTLSLTRIKATLGADDPAPPPRRRPSQPGYDVSFSHFHPFSDNTTSSVA